MKKHKFWIFLNSLFAFVSAYIFLKAVIILSRFLLIRFLGGSTILSNFELECSNSPYSGFWNHFTVLSIYLIGFVVSSVFIIIAYGFYKKFKNRKGLLKLWFVWLYVIAISQSFGVFLRDIPFSRDIYHALNWMFIPYGGMLGIAFLSLPALFFLNFMNIIRFLKMSPSYEYIETREQERSFYTRIALLPALTGSVIITLLNINDTKSFELLEKLVILFCVGVAYLHFLRKNKRIRFRRVKNDTTDQPNVLVFILFIVAIIAYYVISSIFY